MSILNSAKPTSELARHDGVKILVYGPAGAGKTSLCATTGDPKHTLILSAESGLLSIADSDMPAITVKSVQTLRDVHHALANEGHDYKWVCLDSISEIAEVCLQEEMGKTNNGIKAYGEMATTMTRIVKAFRDLPLNVVMTCKQTVIEDDGQVMLTPSTPGKKLAEGLPYLFDEVFRLVVQRDEEGHVKRALRTDGDGKSIAKDRSGKLSAWEQPNLQTITQKIYGE